MDGERKRRMERKRETERAVLCIFTSKKNENLLEQDMPPLKNLNTFGHYNEMKVGRKERA